MPRPRLLAGKPGAVPGGNAASPWPLLSDEMVLYVLSFLDRQDLVRLMGVNRSFRRLATDDSLWRELFAHPGIDTFIPWAVSRQDWLSVPRKGSETLWSRYLLIRRASAHYSKLGRRRRRAHKPVEFAAQPQWQVLGIIAVADVVVTLSTDGRLRSYHVDTLDLVRVSKHAHPLPPLVFVQEDAAMISEGAIQRPALTVDPHHVMLWRLPSLELQCIVRNPDSVIAGAAVSQDSRYLTCWSSSEVAVWDVSRTLNRRAGSSVARRRRSTSVSRSQGSGSQHARRQHRRSSSRSSSHSLGTKQARHQRRGSGSGPAQDSRGSRRRGSSRSSVHGPLPERCYHFVPSDEAEELERRRNHETPALRLEPEYVVRVRGAGFAHTGGAVCIVVVLEHALIMRRLGRDAGLVGRTDLGSRGTLQQVYVSTVQSQVALVYHGGTGPGLFLARYPFQADAGFGAKHVKVIEDFYYSGQPVWLSPSRSKGLFVGLMSGFVWQMSSGHCTVLVPGTASFSDLPSSSKPQTMLLKHWWTQQRVHSVTYRLNAFLAGNRDVIVGYSRRPVDILRHYSYGEYPHDLVSEQDSLVSMAVSLPYLFTAGGPSHSIKRWNLLNPPSRIPKLPSLSPLNSSDELRPFVPISVAVLLPALYVLWQLVLDQVITPQPYPFTVVLLPIVWLLGLMIVATIVAHATRVKRDDVVAAASLALQRASIVIAVCWTPHFAIARTDGWSGIPWILATLPLWLSAIAVSVVLIRVTLVHRQFFSVYAFLQTSSFAIFTIMASVAVDYHASVSITHQDAFWALLVGDAATFLLTVAVMIWPFAAELIKVHHWSLPPPLDFRWSDREKRSFVLAWFVLISLLSTFKFLWYLRLFLLPDLSYALVFLPVDCLPLVPLTYSLAGMCR